jgi:Zn-dependent protease with chaperone function
MPRTPLPLLLLSLISIPLTYAAVALSMFVTIGFAVLLFLIVEELPRVPAFVLVAMLVAPVLAVWAAARAIGRVLASSAGMQQAVIIPFKDRPDLRALVSDVCRRVGSRMPENVLLQAGPVFYVTQARMKTFDGIVTGRTLALGAPILHQLDAGELSAVLAHEFAHFSGRDVMYSTFTYRAYQGLEASLQTLMEAYNQRRSAAGWIMRTLQLPSIHLLLSSYEYFHSIDMILSRRRELRADWISARTYGKEPFSRALRKCAAIDAHFSESLKSIRWSDERAFFSAYDGLVRCAEASLDAFSRQKESEVETELSSHPSISTRVDTLPPFPAGPAAEVSRLPAELAGDEGRLSTLFTPLVAEYQQGLSESIAERPRESVSDDPRAEAVSDGATTCPSCGRTVVPTFHGTCPECNEFIS